MTSRREDLRVEDLGLLSEAEGLANRSSIYKPEDQGVGIAMWREKKI